ncbi:penicillin-insensitive murein endopeptidase [Rhizobium sp. C4]|uniref:penicillin-insensitive murein endopeptidase n=1 Tax=Rhizobium sp. C4 TaxID=1349800 RepID=UPI003FA75F7F
MMQFRKVALVVAALMPTLADLVEAADNRPAKATFGAMTLGSSQEPQPIGFYAKGCQAGAVQLPYDGPSWQVMRLERNRRWGQPQMISFIQQFSRDATRDGWPGLLIGDISQPRGGPMVNGHASHQIGLDADIWLSPMPRQRLSGEEREKLAAVSMLKKGEYLTIDNRNWSSGQARLIMRAASYPQVQRVFVNPAIKKKLCETWTGDRSFMGKVRPIGGHDSHFHVRLFCPPGVANCKAQPEVQPGDGCGKDLDAWFAPRTVKKPTSPIKPPPKPRIITVGDLPPACQAVLASSARRGDDNMGMPYAPLASADSSVGTPITTLAAYREKMTGPAAMATAAMPENPSTVATAADPAPTSAAAAPWIALPEKVPVPRVRPVH